MRRLLIICGTAAALATMASSANAGWQEFWHRVGVDFHRNNAWPEPFQSADRQVTREYFRIQVSNGWRLQNTVGTWFFDENTGALNQAGDLKIKHIVTQNPVHRRTVFVLQGSTAEQTAARVESVQQAVSKYVPEGPLPQILLTDVDLTGGAGAYYDKVNAAFQNVAPTLTLGGGSGGNGGEGSGQSGSSGSGNSGSGKSGGGK